MSAPADSSGFSERRAFEPVAAALAGFFGPRLAAGRRIGVALSGGRDSVVLLHALHAWVRADKVPVELSAIHIHHGLSSQADAWAAFCESSCHALGIPLTVVRVAVARGSGEGPEGAARRVRHAAFAEYGADWLALAHHADDQAETVLLNLLRGAGVAGGAGMRAERPQARGPVLVRPLLDVPRQSIEDYAALHGLAWVDDDSNTDVHFRRNFLRHEILPRLDEKFPGARRALARAAGHFAEGAELLDALAGEDYAALVGAGRDGLLPLSALNALPPSRARNLLRFVWVRAGFRAPETRWIAEAQKQLSTAAPTSEVALSTADGELHVYRGALYVVPHFPLPPEAPVCWRGAEELRWAGGRLRLVDVAGGGMRRELFEQGRLTVCRPRGGESLRPDRRRPRRSLRNLCQEAGVPPWERRRLPYLWCADRLVWVGGLGLDAAFAGRSDEAGVYPLWLPESV